MTSMYNTESWRDDFDLEPNVHPTIAYALHAMRMHQAAAMANEKPAPAPVAAPARWPFPIKHIPPDAKPAPRHPDAEDAPW